MTKNYAKGHKMKPKSTQHKPKPPKARPKLM